MTLQLLSIILCLLLLGCASARITRFKWVGGKKVPIETIEFYGQGKAKVSKDGYEMEGKPALRMPDIPSLPIKFQAQ